MATKAIRVYFHKPINSTWDELGHRLRDLEYKTAKILNYGMTQFWLWQVEKERVKDETGKYPDNKELPHPAYTITQPVKVFIKAQFPDYPSGSVSALSMFLKAKWSSECKDAFYRNNKSMSTFKKGYPILCSNAQYKIEHRKSEGDILTLTLASKLHEGVKRFEIELKTMKTKSSERAILDRLITGQYKQGELKLKQDKRKKQWYASIAYTFTPEEKSLNPDIICGIDLGVAVPFYAAISGSHERLMPHDGMEIFSFRRQIDKRRKAMQRQFKFSERGGRGRDKALTPLDKLQCKVDNFRDSKYHIYTKRIIEFCVKNQAGTIQLEDLSGLIEDKQDNAFLKDWALSSFYEKLEYKAKEAGIVIKKVNPRYTSQRCSKCGCIDRENRKKQSDFLCISCGHKANADYNAACNLAIYGIDDIISAELNNKTKAA